MSVRLLRSEQALQNRDQFGFFDHFLWYITAHLWTSVVTDSGTVAVGDAHAGVVTLTPSDGSVADNDEAYMKTSNELFLPAANKTLVFEARLKYAEVNTDDANVAFGFMSAVAANSILDNGGGPAASYSGAVFFKVDGGTAWQCESSNGGTQTTTLTNTTAGGSSYVTFRIEIRALDSTSAEVVFFINDAQCRDSSGNVFKHTLSLTSLTEMNAFVGVKNGDTNLETVLVDYVGAYANV